MGKKNKEFKINTNSYRIKYGGIKYNDNKSIFIKINGWGETLIEEENFKPILNKIKKDIHLKIKNKKVNNFLNDFFIVDFDMRESGIKKGKKSFMNCTINLYQKHNKPLHDNDIQKEIKSVINTVITEVLDKTQHFNFNSTK